MIVSEFIADVSQRATQASSQTVSNSETLKQHLLRQFNMYYKDFNKRYPWPWRQKDVVIQTVPNYTTGAVVVTNGSRTVIGSGTTWTAAMIGRMLKLDRDQELYEIQAVPSVSSITLRVPYAGDSGSSQTYLIWKKFYELPPEVPYLEDMTMARWPYTTNEIPKKAFDANLIRAWEINSLSLIWTWGGIDRTTKTYAGGGSISVPQNSNVLTGVGTAFLDNVFGGSRVLIGVKVFNVDTVDSDTQLTLVQKSEDLINASTDFSITTKNRSRVQLSAVPTPPVNLLITFFKKTYDYINDNDEPEIWEGHEHIITDVMYGSLLEKLTSQKAFAWYDVYRGKIKEAWINLNERTSTEQVPRIQRRTLAGYRPSLYGG